MRHLETHAFTRLTPVYAYRHSAVMSRDDEDSDVRDARQWLDDFEASHNADQVGSIIWVVVLILVVIGFAALMGVTG